MLVINDVTLHIIYNHEEDYDKMIAWLKTKNSLNLPDLALIPTTDGYYAYMDTIMNDLFCQVFDICDGRGDPIRSRYPITFKPEKIEAERKLAGIE